MYRRPAPVLCSVWYVFRYSTVMLAKMVTKFPSSATLFAQLATFAHLSVWFIMADFWGFGIKFKKLTNVLGIP